MTLAQPALSAAGLGICSHTVIPHRRGPAVTCMNGPMSGLWFSIMSPSHNSLTKYKNDTFFLNRYLLTVGLHVVPCNLLASWPSLVDVPLFSAKINSTIHNNIL